MKSAFCLKFLRNFVSTYAVIPLTSHENINILPKSVTAAQARENGNSDLARSCIEKEKRNLA